MISKNFKIISEKNLRPPMRSILTKRILDTYFYEMLDSDFNEIELLNKLDKMNIKQLEYFLKNGSL